MHLSTDLASPESIREPRRPRTPRDPEATRERLLDAALGLFTERTFGGTTMPAMAQRAGIGVGTIYRYFPSKEALGNAVFRRCKAAMGEALARGGSEGETTREAVRRLWHNLAAFATEQPEALAFLEHQQHATYLDEQSALVSAEVEGQVVEVVRRGQDSGELRQDDPGLLVSLAFGAFVGLTKATRAADAPLDAATLSAAETAVWDMLRSR